MVLKLFRNRPFSLLTVSFLSSSIANWIYKLALPIIILDKTGSAFHAAGIFGFSFIPWVLFSIFGGVVADTYTKSRVLFLGNIVSAIGAILLIVGTQMQPINIYVIYGIVFLISSADPLIHPSFQSLIPEIINKRELVAANSIIQTIENTLSVVGPLVGGGVVTILGGYNTLWFSGIFFLIAGFMTLMIHSHHEKKVFSFKKIWQDTVVGLKYVFNQKVILSGAMMFFFANLGTNMFEANYMYFMTKDLKFSVVDTTITMAMSGVGALLGGPVGSKIIPNFKSGKILSFSTVGAGLLILLLNTTTNFILLGLILGCISFFGTINVVTYFTLRQQTVPISLLGRVVAVTRMMSFASIPIGAFIGGKMLAAGLGMATVILAAGIIRTLTGIFAAFSQLGKE
ncbi:MFS transporter [Weissella viridescens]|uniref:MFS transporter n=1 Tax=Weissella viridescens TaxID=1629 RepID=A0A3P2RMG2_WEIVI|nr:MFS transporter [Weissella viridescens]RRG18892.1 MFS transporter [Weissella viridescens]